ncbi:D-inositol 3-phosphate glycosyltransferase-like [Acropora muricata]|uniref:D-inositol 3-phosphate glycosyltransferase-like n=1 Tax=Acropora muricata TaxID=159855 RepID=UPI0034E41856
MMPGCDKAFVFVSGGVRPACKEDMKDFYLRFDGNTTHRAELEVCVNCVKEFCKVDFRNTSEQTESRNLLSTLYLRLPFPSIDRPVSPFSNASVPPLEEASRGCSILTSSWNLKVTLLSSEWGSTRGGLSTINRELAIQLARDDNMDVCMYLPAFSGKDKKAADKCKVRLLKAKEKPGYDEPIDWLASVPRDHQMNVVIGHGIHLGRQIPHIKESHPECKWIQVVHTDPEELGMFKTYTDPIAKGEKKHEAEVKLCQEADQVVAVGPKLADTCSHSYEKKKVLVLTPGIFSEFADVNQATEEREVFHVLVFGRGDSEDFTLKGYDIAAKAVAKLKDEKHAFKLVFVGAPSGKEEQLTEMLLDKGISRSQLIVRSAKKRKQLSQEFYGADLAIMPSRAEGFGLSALEALSAGLPVLVTHNSGLGQALKKVRLGTSVIVNSEDPAEWAEAIRRVRSKPRSVRLKEASDLRKNYSEKYNWEKQCSRLVDKIHELVVGPKKTAKTTTFV